MGRDVTTKIQGKLVQIIDNNPVESRESRSINL